MHAQPQSQCTVISQKYKENLALEISSERWCGHNGIQIMASIVQGILAPHLHRTSGDDRPIVVMTCGMAGRQLTPPLIVPKTD